MATVVINGTTLTFNNVYYVDPVNGVDAAGRGSQTSPFKTVNYASQQCAASGDAVYALAGTHDVTYVSGSYGCGGLYDYGKSISYIGVPGKTIFLCDGVKNNGRDHHAVCTYGTNTKIYNIIFDQRCNGRTATYMNAIFGRDSTYVNATCYNCVFMNDSTIPTCIYDNSGSNNITLYNCVFYVQVDMVQSYSGGTRPTKINCACNKKMYQEGTMTNCLDNATFGRDWSIPSTSSIGVMGGTFAWTPSNNSPVATTGQLRTRIQDMQIGDFIACNYQAQLGAVGSFSNFGGTPGPEIPSGSSVPNGTFYLIKVDKGLLVADRVVQTSISWDTLNAGGLIQGAKGNPEIALLHFDTDFSDDVGNIWTPSGACSIDISRPPKIGAGCLYTPSGSHLSSTNTSFALGTRDFTVDFWMYYGGSGYSGLSTAFVNGAYGFAVQPDGVWLGNNSTISQVSSSGYFVTGAWAHYALVRKGNTFYYFVNGVLKGAATFSVNLQGVTLVINGRYGSGGYPGGNAYYDEVSVVRYAKWTTNFTPPTTPNTASVSIPYVIRSITGGVAYADADGNLTFNTGATDYGCFPTNNEWDKYIRLSNLDGKVTPNDPNVWHFDVARTWSQDTPVSGTYKSNTNATGTTNNTYRMSRGSNADWNSIAMVLSSTASTLYGFRPVFEYKEG